MRKKGELIPLSKALIQIFLSTLIISGSATLYWLYSEHAKVVGSKDERHNIIGVVQTGPEKNQLPTDYLVEVLGLSVDAPTNLYLFNVSEAEKRLLATPFVKQVKIKKVQPNALSVDYTVRTPIARLLERPGIGVDANGAEFPLEPFYQERGLPHVLYDEDTFALVGEVLDLVPDAQLVDVSRARSQQYGLREVVVRTADGIYLRLHPERIPQGLQNYDTLQEKVEEDFRAVDLRLSELAFLL